MKIAILDDYFDTLRTLPSFRLLDRHDVRIWNDHTDDVDVLAERLAEVDALVLIRERTAITSTLLERLSAPGPRWSTDHRASDARISHRLGIVSVCGPALASGRHVRK